MKDIGHKSVRELSYQELRLELTRCIDYLDSFFYTVPSNQKQLRKRIEQIEKRLKQEYNDGSTE